MIRNLLFASAILTVLELLLTFSGVDGLQCYNCRGITNYDPNECFTPTSKTIVQECQKNEVCEKRVTMVDRLQDVIDRGCSANCANRNFIWTDEYQVYCCNDQNLCNSAVGFLRSSSFTAVIVTTTAALLCAVLLTVCG
jgi:hypothetical protein